MFCQFLCAPTSHYTVLASLSSALWVQINRGSLPYLFLRDNPACPPVLGIWWYISLYLLSKHSYFAIFLILTYLVTPTGWAQITSVSSFPSSSNTDGSFKPSKLYHLLPVLIQLTPLLIALVLLTRGLHRYYPFLPTILFYIVPTQFQSLLLNFLIFHSTSNR